MLSDTWGHSQVEETALHPDESAVDIYDALPGGAAGALPPQRFRRAVLPHRTLKEAESIAGQLIKAVDTLPNE